MKKYSILLIFIVITSCLLCLFLVLFNTRKDNVLTIRVGVYENEPKIFTDDKGNWVGFWPNIIQYIANQERWKIEYVEGTWTEGLIRLENNEIDIMVDMGYSEERSLIYDFNNVSVFTNWGIIFARERGTILSFSDLENKTIAVMDNSIHYTGEFGIKNLTSLFGINCTFLVVPDYYEVFNLIDNDTVDAGVVNRLFGLSNKDDYDVVQTSLFFNPIDLYFAFPKNATLNHYLIERIDYHLTELQADPSSIYYASIEEYFLQIAVKETIPEWIIFTIIGIVALVVVFLLMSVYLKRTVNERTKELRESNIELELLNQILIQTIPNGVLFVNRDGKISIINNEFKDLYFTNYQQEIKPSTNIFKLTDNVLITAIKEEIRNSRKDRTLEEGEVKKRTLSLESPVHLELSYSKMHQRGFSEDFGFLFVTNDVTPFIELENLRKEFVSMVSHELKTPITAINLSLNNLINYQERLDKEEQKTILNIMKRSVSILSEMIEDLLTLSSVEARALELDKAECDIPETVLEIYNEMQFRLAEKNLTLSMDIPPNIKLIGDPKRISQVLRILIDNAIKYSGPNSEIKVQANDDFIPPKPVGSIPGVLIKVIDKGIGIPMEDQYKLFNKFHRGSNIAGITGSGLGLNIAKTLVELHNGTISVQSDKGKGTTISVFLPKVKR